MMNDCKRRWFLNGMALFLAGWFGLGAAAAERPTVVFIMADDLGWADVGFHGGSAPTPHLDRLAAESLELRQHYVAPVCSPTRAGLMSGRYWSRFGITTPHAERAMPEGTVTVAGALKEAGYATCMTGKWHLGSKPVWGPQHYGFDHVYGSLGGGVGPYNHRYKEGPYTRTWQRGGELIEEEGHVTDLVTAEALRWIAERGDEAFFLYIPHPAVHLPVKEPDVWLERVPAEIQGVVARQYAACIMHLDDAVGQVLAALESKGVRDRTLVVFTSDNGGSTAQNNDTKYPADDYETGRLTGNNLPLRAEKGSLYEGGTRVPCLVNWPGKVAPGVSEVPVHIVDWMPTFCALAGWGGERDLKWDGVDLSGLLLEGREPGERSLYSAGTGFKSRALRRGDWKLIEFGSQDKPRYELYHIGLDESEQEDLAQREAARVEGLKAELQRLMAADNDAKVK